MPWRNTGSSLPNWQKTEKIRRRSYAVILLDEIEKAHHNVLNILLQILDDGRLTDTKGRTVNFKNTIIIMTSNLRKEELKTALRPEFINRIDDIIFFNDLQEDVIRGIVDLQLKLLHQQLDEQHVTLTVDESVREYLTRNGYEPEYGARPIKRSIKREILSRLFKTMLQRPETQSLAVSMDGDEIVVEVVVEKPVRKKAS